MMERSIAAAYVDEVVSRPKLQHAAVRVGLMLAAIAERTGSKTVALCKNNFITGLEDGSGTVVVPGVQFRYETISASLASLESEGLLKIDEADFTIKGHRPSLYTLQVA